ncbi:MAG: hypothetical protein JXD19_00780 [Deltaproteobacteria bacterium]|nr:hypothetical protein [Deltaproteobacteria bacterium]
MEFEINFLTYKKSTIFLESILAKARHLNTAKVRLISLLLLLGLVTVLLGSFYSKSISRKTTRVVTTGQSFLKVTLEKEKMANLVNLLLEVQKKRIAWWEKLTSISELVPDQVFLTSMELQEERSGGGAKREENEQLVLKGVVVNAGGSDPSQYIDKFMKDLKSNPSFMAGLDEPLLVSVSNSTGSHANVEFEVHLAKRVSE